MTLAPGKVLLEAQDVFDIGAAPGVDRLVVIADTAQIAVGLGDEPEKKVLNDVRVLVLVDQDVTETPAECVENIADVRARAATARAGGRRSPPH